MAWISALAVLITAVILAIAPLRQGARGWHDIRWIYVAGMCWADGVSPYLLPNFAERWMELPENFAGEGVEPTQPFVYPPYVGAIAVPMSLLPWPIARRVWDLINVVAFACVLLFPLALVRRFGAADLRAPPLLALAGVAGLLGAIPYTTATSQLSLVAVAAIAGMFWAKESGRTRWIPLFVLLAGVKPQLALLPVLYLAASGAFLEVVIAAIIGLLLSLAVLLPSSLPHFVSEYLAASVLHAEAPFNSRTNFTSFPALFGTTAWSDALFALVSLAACAVVVWLGRRRNPKELLVVLALIPATIPLHVYDLVIYAPLIILLPLTRRVDLAVIAAIAAHLGARAISLEQWLGRDPGDLVEAVRLAPFFTAAVAICVVSASVRMRARATSSSAVTVA